MDNKCVICGKEPLIDFNTEGIITISLPDNKKASCCLHHTKEELQEYISQFIQPSDIEKNSEKVFLSTI